MRGFKRRLKPLHRASVLAQCLPPHAVMFPSAASLCSAITAGTSTEGDVQSMTFDVVSSPATSLLPARQRRAAADQQRDRAAIQHIYSSPCNYQTGSTYYGTVDVTSESNRLSLMLYHVAAKVDLMWNVDKTVQADNRLTYIQARRLKQQGCKPRHWNASSRPAVSPGTRGSRGAMPWTTCRKPSTACTKRCCPQASRRAPSMWQREITYYGRRHGRSGGIYVRNCGSIYNSVFWGNKCAANNDMQFACIRQNASSTEGIDVYFSAFYNQDITDWSDVTKEQVYNLSEWNRPHRANAGECCWFELNYNLLSKQGTVDWWDPSASGSLNRDLKAGVDYDDATMQPNSPQILTTWRPRHATYLTMKGVQVSSTLHIDSEWIRHAHVSTDILGSPYETVSTLGAISERGETYKHTLAPQQGEEGRQVLGSAGDPARLIPTMFVDIQRNNIKISDTDRYEDLGESWDFPAAFIADAVNYFETYRIKDQSSADFNKYRMPGDDTVYPAVQILVKEGTLTTAGTGSYNGDDIRTASIRPKSNMRFYGGYPSDLTDTDTSGRNPDKYITLLSSNIVGQYKYNSAHGFAIVNAQNVIIDGIRMAYGNMVGIETKDIVNKGASLIVSNATVPVSERIDMTGNELRNSVIANTQAYDGSAVYVNSILPKADGTTTRSILTVRNTIIRNCTSIEDDDMDSGDGAGVVVANGNALVKLDHCTIVNNVGSPLKTQTGNRNPIVNAGDDASMTKRDRTDIDFFNYGGAADLGAIENITFCAVDFFNTEDTEFTENMQL